MSTESSRSWRTNNPEKSRAKNRADRKKWYATHKAKAASQARAWDAANPEKSAATKRAAHSRWAKRNPGQRRASTRRHKALKMGATGFHTEAEFKALGDTCLCCGRSNLPMTEDHVLPLVHGGNDAIENIQPLCLPCNSKKRDRFIDYRP